MVLVSRLDLLEPQCVIIGTDPKALSSLFDPSFTQCLQSALHQYKETPMIAPFSTSQHPLFCLFS